MNPRIIILGIIISIYALSEFYIYSNLKIILRGTRFPYLYWSLYALSIVLVFVSFIHTYLTFSNGGGQFTPRSGLTNFFIGFAFTLIVSKLIFALLLIFVDFSRFLAFVTDKVVQWFNPNSSPITLSGRRNFLIKSGLALAAVPFASFLYGITIGKYNYKIKRQSLSFDNLNPAFDDYKIIQISDIHAGSFDSKSSVQKAIDMINSEQPDLVLFTGDLVNDRAEEIDPYIDVFRGINAKDGVFSITGNHDYGDYVAWPSEEEKQANFSRLIQKHKELGFNILMNENVRIIRGDAHFNIIGIENWGLPPFPQKGDLTKASVGVDNAFTILLSHDPSHWDAETTKKFKNIDLTLSGHTHGMQFGIEIPGIKWSPVKYKYPKWAGLYQEKNQYLYVNRGFGFLGLPGRVGIWPEITVFNLKSTMLS